MRLNTGENNIIKMTKTKIFAAYLPQYHETEDNNKFWGKGYTDWCAVKAAHSLFEGHRQPRVPLNGEYYDLSDVHSIEWQAKLAKEYGISGFNIYHYWFKDGRKSLETPAELLLAHPEIDIEFFFTWDNGSWRRTWSNVAGNDWAPKFEKNGANQNEQVNAIDKSGILIEFAYQGQEAWKEHFDYLVPFFRDKRYLKIDNKPVFMFFSREHKEIAQMREYWNHLAKAIGFDGVYICTQKSYFVKAHAVDAQFVYQPTYSSWGLSAKIKAKVKQYLKLSKNNKLKKYNYENCWKKIINDTKVLPLNRVIPGCFVGYDDTPRRGARGRTVLYQTPELFGQYFSQLYNICCKRGDRILLITAWNEWGEGAYLEPDDYDKYGYLEAIKKTVNKV